MKYLVLLCAALLNINVLVAQPKERTRFPKAILVQLSSEHNRMRSLEKMNAQKELEQLKHDAKEVRKRMRMDFRDNFHMYPVYFFADTNLEKVNMGQLAGILSDADGDSVLRTELGNSMDFFIVYYGYPVVAGKHHTKLISDKADEARSFDTHLGKYLIVCNNRMEQLTYIHQRQPRVLRDVRPQDRKYYYTSPRYDIGYHAVAKKLPDVITGLPLNYQ